MENKVQTAELWIFRFMCGFALFSSISIALQNVFLILSVTGLLYRLYLKHDDIKEALNIDKHLLYPFFIWMAAIILSSLTSADSVWGLRVFGDYYVYHMSGLFVVLIAIRDRQRIITLAKMCFISMYIGGMYCLYKWLFLHQISGGFLPRMSLGGILAMAIPLLLLGLLAAKQYRWQFTMAAIVAGFIAIGDSVRGMWVSCAVVAVLLVFLLIKGTKKKLLVICLSVLVVTGGIFVIPGLHDRVSTIANPKFQANSERFLLWRSSYNMFLDHPVFGVGFGRFHKEYQTKYILPEAKERNLGHAHSNVMQMLGECGAVGVTAFIFWWLYTSWYVLKNWFKKQQLGWLILFLTLTGILLQGLTEYNLGNSLLTKLFWTVIGMSLQWIKIENTTKGSSQLE